MNPKIIRPSKITASLLSESSPTKKVRITTVGWNLFDLYRTTGAGYYLENVIQGTKLSFKFLTDLKSFISKHA